MMSELGNVKTYKEQAAKLLRDPDDAVALVNQFVLMAKNGRPLPSHLAMTRRAYALAPNEFQAVFNLAAALSRAGQPRAAMARFMDAMLLAPPGEKALTMYNVGMCWHDLEDYGRALHWYEQALAIKDDVTFRHGIAVAKMCNGQLGDGLHEFEVLWHSPNKKAIGSSGIPRWNSQDLRGKKLIICHEQGFGDTLNFCRLIPRLKETTGSLVWSGPPILNGLIEDNFDVEIVDEIGPFDADYYCSPLSAAGALRLNYDEVKGDPYLVALPMPMLARGKIKVGFSWAGSPTYARDHDRSMKLADLCPLLDIPGTAFYSFQLRPDGTEISNLGLDGLVANLETLLTDWRATARAIAAMDLMICVDTGTAHLAGALGKKTALLLGSTPCWRWAKQTKKTPWYANHEIFRQSRPGSWTWPVEMVKQWLLTNSN